MLRLLDTTLVCADCKNHNLALSAISNCLNQVAFQEVLFFTNKNFTLPGKTIQINSLNSTGAYSNYIFKEIHKYVKTKFILICQYDGFIINPSSWDNKFYNYDYIGAPWRHHGGQVGNGGFSFRSLKLHQILSSERFNRTHPEDDMICRNYRIVLENEYKIKFAPTKLAEKFSIEGSAREIREKIPFGFHNKQFINEGKNMTINFHSRQSRYIPLL